MFLKGVLQAWDRGLKHSSLSSWRTKHYLGNTYMVF